MEDCREPGLFEMEDWVNEEPETIWPIIWPMMRIELILKGTL